MPTGGYEYARRVLAVWQEQGIEAQVVGLPGGFPFPDDHELRDTAKALRTVEGPLLIDGLAYGAFPEDLAAEIGPRSTVLLHHPLCDEQGLKPETAARLETGERAALQHVGNIVVTSPNTARELAGRFGVTVAVVAIPGTDMAPVAALSGEPPVVLSVGTITPRKGYPSLIRALSACRDLDWRCEVIGAIDRDPDHFEAVKDLISANGLQNRIILRGARDDISGIYLSADLFVSTSLHEGYGMAVVEAMAHGLPVVGTTAGALAETAPCARLIPPGDLPALSGALRDLLASRDERLALGQVCRDFAQNLPDWDTTAQLVARAVLEISP